MIVQKWLTCKIGPWVLIGPTINLCKPFAVIDDKPH